jgi:hypothetical protein
MAPRNWSRSIPILIEDFNVPSHDAVVGDSTIVAPNGSNNQGGGPIQRTIVVTAGPDRYHYEVKWDGWRALVHVDNGGVEVRTRTGREASERSSASGVEGSWCRFEGRRHEGAGQGLSAR